MATFISLADKLNHAFSKITSRGSLTELEIKQVMREIRIALLEADVSLEVVKKFISDVSEQCLGEKVLKSLTPSQQIIKIVNEQLVELMGSTHSKLIVSSKLPTVILMCGLQGAGKTSTCGKLAHYLASQGKKTLLVACDIYRPAAINQLKVNADKAKAGFFENGINPPDKTAKLAVDYALKNGFDTVIIDTAGRLHINQQLMDELVDITKSVSVSEILLTVDSMTGQDAVNVAKVFSQTLDISGIIMTKLDGDTRGGSTLSIKAVTNKPIKFICTGEKIGDLEVFYPDRMANRILGMGDVLTLIDKAQQAFSTSDAQRMVTKLKDSSFDLNDYLMQFESMKKMGNINDIVGMLPGANKLKGNVNIDEKEILHTKAIIQSMTDEERKDHKILNYSRRKRIASGSGTKVQDVNKLIKQFEQTKDMMKKFTGKGSKGLPKFPI